MKDYIEKLEELANKMKKSYLSPRVLISKFRFIEEESRYSRACLDSNYIPFYYYLGMIFPVKNLLEIGFGLGLNAGVYLTGSKITENYLTIQEPSDSYYSTRIGRSNIKQVWKKKFYSHYGKVYDEEFIKKIKERKWGLTIISDKVEYDTHLLWLNTVWDEMEDYGLICMDYITAHDQAKRAYKDFCIIKNRDQYIFDSRYGVGVIFK
jgi:hypothetical protein